MASTQIVSSAPELPASARTGTIYLVLDTRKYMKFDGGWTELTSDSTPSVMSSMTRQTWVNGIKKSNVKELMTSASVLSGVVSFNLTDSSTGLAVFSNIYKESVSVWVEDDNDEFEFSGYSVAGDRKSLGININRRSTSSTNALINLLGGVTTFLTGITYVAAPNGTVVYLSIKGD